VKNGRHCGFTLIELLVVIAVIALLAAILFPVFAQALEKGRQTSCLSNVKQIATAIMLYLQDHDEFFPPVVEIYPSDVWLFEGTWMKRLEPYTKNLGIFICPSSQYRDLNWQAGKPDLLFNYSFSPTIRSTPTGSDATDLTGAFGTAKWEGLGGYFGTKRIGYYSRIAPSHGLAEVARPAETVAINDHNSFDWGLTASQFYYPEPRHVREKDVELPNGLKYPSGLMNAVFCDGHAKALKQERLLEIRKDFTTRYGSPRDVYIHFWPYD
jgi:prepilin-type N-terminal cleavage/methylation domain-containing protein/prepilin-type processing-associated H-X9-DG protein